MGEMDRVEGAWHMREDVVVAGRVMGRGEMMGWLGGMEEVLEVVKRGRKRLE